MKSGALFSPGTVHTLIKTIFVFDTESYLNENQIRPSLFECHAVCAQTIICILKCSFKRWFLRSVSLGVAEDKISKENCYIFNSNLYAIFRQIRNVQKNLFTFPDFDKKSGVLKIRHTKAILYKQKLPINFYFIFFIG